MNNINIPKAFLPGFGSRLADARKKIKKTQSDFGRVLGVRNTAVSKWETEGGVIDERSLVTLQVAFQINPRWVACAEEPMILQTWDRDNIRKVFESAADASVSGLFTVPKSHGMSPSVETGDVLMYSAGELIHGDIFIVAPPKVEAVRDGIATKACAVGRAIRIETGAGSFRWALYRDEDALNPGHYYAIPIDDWQVLGRVVLTARPIR